MARLTLKETGQFCNQGCSNMIGRTAAARNEARRALHSELSLAFSDFAEDQGDRPATGRKASLIADQYDRHERVLRPGAPMDERHPTNEEVAKAVQQRCAVRGWSA
jgi:hypothetical protein